MSSYTEGQIHQLANALESHEFTPDDVTKLGQYRELQNIRGVLCGTHEIKPIPHLINCDADPVIPNGWSVVEHRPGGIFTWDPTKVTLHLSKRQKEGKCVTGNELHTELAKKTVLDANVLDYLLKPENQHLIPEEWKGKYVFFWGTIYRNSGGDRCVRCLCWDGGRWDWVYRWLCGDWDGRSPAVLRAS